jgi:ABC-type glycerol-3-phosphate transport system substrate-binding protein
MRIRKLTALVALTALAVAALVATSTAGAKTKHRGVSGSISITGVWTGAEEQNFQAVIDGFTKANPDVKVKYTSSGDQTPTVLATAVAGGNPPDLASVSQPGLMKDFANRGALKPIDFAKGVIAANYTPSWSTLGSVNGHLYGLFFKGANKSTVWYNVKAFKNAGVKPPATWPALLAAAKTLRASGTPAYAIGGADGWTLTDLFENIYLRSAGAATYDQLTTHKLKWTDASVKAALKIMGQVLNDTANIPGGRSGALQTDFPTSVDEVLNASPKAAMIFEGDFVPGVSKSGSKALTDYNVFAFPKIGASPPSVVGGGDIVMMFKDTPAVRAFVSYLATSEAASIWAAKGGFSSPNKNVKASTYTDPLNRSTAIALSHAKTFRFDLSDLQPAAFGGTVGQGEFKIFQDFLKNPKNVNGVAAALEKSAAAAYKKK